MLGQQIITETDVKRQVTREEIIKELRKTEEGFAVCSAFLCLCGSSSKNEEICSQGIRAKKQMDLFREAAKMIEEDKKERENRVLTLEEATESADPVWLEAMSTLRIAQIYLSPGEGLAEYKTIGRAYPEYLYTGDYKKLWRCWLRKPTAEEMANATWEE